MFLVVLFALDLAQTKKHFKKRYRRGYGVYSGFLSFTYLSFYFLLYVGVSLPYFSLFFSIILLKYFIIIFILQDPQVTEAQSLIVF